jgi:hypothetical protein
MAPNYESDDLEEEEDDDEVEEEVEEEEVATAVAAKKRSKKAWKVCEETHIFCLLVFLLTIDMNCIQ